MIATDSSASTAAVTAHNVVLDIGLPLFPEKTELATDEHG